MTSLERICAPARADSDAPASLTWLHREEPSFDSCSKHAKDHSRYATAVHLVLGHDPTVEGSRSAALGVCLSPGADAQQRTVRLSSAVV